MAGIIVTPALAPNDPVRRQQDMTLTGMAVTGMTGMPLLAGGTPATQVVYGAGIYLYAGEVINNIITCTVVAGTSTAPTNIKLGVWSSAATPVVLALTADLSASSNWTATGFKSSALTGAYTVPSSGVYYLSFWMNGAFAGTALQLGAVNQAGPTNNQIGSGARPWTALKTSASSLTVSDTGTYSAGVINPWFAFT